jgi:hypothetical protein
MISKAPRHDDLITHYPMRACWAGRTAPRPMPKRRKSSAVTPGQRKLTGIGSLGAREQIRRVPHMRRELSSSRAAIPRGRVHRRAFAGAVDVRADAIAWTFRW